MNVLRSIARVKFGLMRVNPYVQMFNTLLLLNVAGWRGWYVLVGIGFVAAYIFEKAYGIKGEMDMTWKNSEEWHKFRKEWDEFRGKG